MSSIVWITGHGGFIAQHVALTLSALDGVYVAGVGRASRSEVGKFSSTVEGTVGGQALQQVAEKTGLPDYVIHLAGGASVGRSILDPRGDFLDSVECASQLFEWIRNASPRTKVVLVSSAAVYGAGHSLPIAETSPMTPSSPYGAHKSAAELLAISYGQTYGVSSCRLRLFSVFGPHLKKQLIYELFCQLKDAPQRLTLHGTGDEQRDWIYVEDAARALWTLKDSASHESPATNVGSGISVSVRAIAEEVVAIAGTNTRIDFNGLSKKGDPRFLVADVNRLQTLGFRSQMVRRDGLEAVHRWTQEK